MTDLAEHTCTMILFFRKLVFSCVPNYFPSIHAKTSTLMYIDNIFSTLVFQILKIIVRRHM